MKAILSRRRVQLVVRFRSALATLPLRSFHCGRYEPHSNRLLATPLTTASILDSCKWLAPSNRHQHISQSRITFITAIAFWRFSSPQHQLSMLERAQSIQGGAAFKRNVAAYATCEG